jgi:hypothetical protein
MNCRGGAEVTECELLAIPVAIGTTPETLSRLIQQLEVDETCWSDPTT